CPRFQPRRIAAGGRQSLVCRQGGRARPRGCLPGEGVIARKGWSWCKPSLANPRCKPEAQSSREEKQDSYSKVSPWITSLLISPQSSLKKHRRKFHRYQP